MAKLGESILRACADLATRRPWTIVLVSLVVTLVTGYASMDLSVNTSTDEILSSRLPFRQTEIAYEKSFPAADLAIVVVDAATPAGAQAAAEDMVRRLDASSHFADVELAGSSPFFDRI
jgi:uncharacterized membrane protein YdfJ with MMPL/SSD domain